MSALGRVAGRVGAADCMNVGASLLFIVVLMPILSAACFYCGYPIGRWIFPVAAAVGLAYTYLSARKWFTVVAQVIFMAVSLLLAYLTADFSWDGQAYHQEFIAALCYGWNPHDLQAYPLEGTVTPWFYHYLKALELVEACVVHTFGHIEMGKAVNMWLIASAGLMAAALLRRYNTRRTAVVYAILLIANPVVIAQAFTYYTDFANYCMTIIAVVCAFEIYRDPRTRLPWVVACAVLLLAIGAKLNGFFYVGFVDICLVIWLLVKRRSRLAGWLCLAGVATLIVALAVFYHPYVTNVILKGNPLYPLVGADKIDIMTRNTPELLRRIDNRLVNFFVGLSIFKPITTDNRFGGFGPLFIPLLLASIVLLIIYRRRLGAAQWYVVGALFVSVFVFKESWWARYVPQVWAAPILTLYFTRPLARGVKLAMIIAIAISIAAAGWSLGQMVIYSARAHWIYSHIHDRVGIVAPRPQEVYHLNEHRIPWEHIEQIDSAYMVNIAVMHTRCQVSQSDFDALKAADPGFDRFQQTRIFVRPGDPLPSYRLDPNPQYLRSK